MVLQHNEMEKRHTHSVDKGWAWVILLTTFLNCLLSSTCYTSGLFNVVFIEMFDKSKALTAWCTSLQLTLLSIGAPISAILIAHIGPRLTIFIGGLCVVMGFTLTYFATTFTHVFLTYGLLAGIGYGLSFSSQMVTLGFYFDKYRVLACSLSSAAFGIGSMFLPPCLNYILNNYGFHGTMLILGAMSGHFFVCSILTLPFNVDNNNNKINFNKDTNIIHFKSSTQLAIESSNGAVWSKEKPILNDKYNLDPQYILVHETIVTSNTDQLNDQLKLTGTADETSCNQDDVQISECTKNNEVIEIKVTDQRKTKKSKLQLNKLLDTNYMLLLFNALMVSSALTCVYLHFPAYATTKNTSISEVTLIISTMGVGNIAGRLLPGVVANNSKIRCYVVAIFVELAGGLISPLGPFVCDTIIGQHIFAFLSAVFGLTFYTLTSPLVIDIVGLEASNVGFCSVMFLTGIGTLVAPPIAGHFFDMTGSYTYTFIMAGIFYISGSLSLILIVILKKIERRKSTAYMMTRKSLI